MNKRVVDEAEAEAKRFLERIDLLKRCAGESEFYGYEHYGSGIGDQYTAAVRRASMDLTRSLARLRRDG